MPKPSTDAPPPATEGGQLQPTTTRRSTRTQHQPTVDELPDDTNIANVGIDVAELATKKSTTAADKEAVNDNNTATANNGKRKSTRQSSQKKNNTSLDTDDDNFNENDFVWCYYTYIDMESGEETTGHWLSAVIFKKICTTSQGHIGSGNYITYNKDTYIIKYDDDNQYDVNRPSSMLRHRAEDDSEPEDDSDPIDTVPPECFINLPTISQLKQPPESLLPESISQHTNTKKAAASSSRKRPAKKPRRQREPPPTIPYIAKGKINSGLPTTIDNAVPDAIKACTTGWKEDQSLKKRKIDVYTEEEYNDEHMGRGVADSYVHAAKSVAHTLSHTAQDMNAANTVSHLISETVFADIRSYTSQQLVKRGLEPVTLYEFKRFYATKLLRSRFNLSTKKAWEAIMSTLAQNHGHLIPLILKDDIILIPKYQALLTNHNAIFL